MTTQFTEDLGVADRAIQRTLGNRGGSILHPAAEASNALPYMPNPARQKVSGESPDYGAMSPDMNPQNAQTTGGSLGPLLQQTADYYTKSTSPPLDTSPVKYDYNAPKDMAQLPRSSYNPAAEAASSNAAAGAANQMVTDIRARDEGKKAGAQAGAQYGAMGEYLPQVQHGPKYTDARTPEQIDASAAQNQMARATLTPEQQMNRGMPVNPAVAARTRMDNPTPSMGQNMQAQYDMNPSGMYHQTMGQTPPINPGLGRRMADTRPQPQSTPFRSNGIPSRFAGSTDPMAASKTRII